MKIYNERQEISCRRVDRLVSPTWLSPSWFVADSTVAEMAGRRDNRTPAVVLLTFCMILSRIDRRRWKSTLSPMLILYSYCRPSGRTPGNVIFMSVQSYTWLKSTFGELQFCRWQYGSIFIRLTFVASQICEIPRKFERIGYSSSRSSILVLKESAYGYNFLLVINSNVSLTVFETLPHKARNWLIFLTPPLFDAHAQGEPARISG